jgi:hypothetical protein
MNRKLSLFAICAAANLVARPAPAQVGSTGGVPFFFSAGTSVETQIGITSSGDSASIPQAVVSHDRKYVTMDMNPQMNTLVGIKPFVAQSAGSGFVGSAAAVRSAAPPPESAFGGGPQRNSLMPSIGVLPSDVALAKITILDQPGMTRIAGLSDR